MGVLRNGGKMRIARTRLAVVALIVGVLAGCGGGGGSAIPVDAGTGGGGGAALAPAPVPPGNAPVNAGGLAADQFAALDMQAVVGGAAVNSPPQVSFALQDQNGNPIVGFGSKSQSATATVAQYPNLAFSLAKLVPGTNGSPARWVSYIITTVPTKNATTGAITPAAPTRPSTDNTGTLVDNGNGTYVYTFYRNVTTIKDEVAGMTVSGSNNKADLGDLTFDPNAVHRLTIQIAGNAPGTGTNTPDGVQVTPAVPMEHPLNVIFDFIPATGQAVAPTDTTVTQRLVVDKLSCQECHGKLGGIPGTDSASFHGGSRYDPKYCVVCHTDQRKYGRTNSVSTNYAFPVDSSGVPLSTYVADGVTVGDFPVLIHRVHKGELLIKQNYNFGGVLLNETKFPQDIRNCTKCHDTTAPKVAPQGDNWKMVPSRLACGACHDGINFDTGKGRRNNGDDTLGHIGGIQKDDSKCALCHSPDAIPTYHVPVTPPNPNNSLLVAASAGGSNNTNAAYIASNPANVPLGAIKVTYDVKSVSRNASKQPVIVFRLLQNGARKDFNTFNPASSIGSQEIWTSFFGAPSVYFVYAVPQDGITAPADFNVSASGYIRSIWNGTSSGSGKGTMTGPDADGYYTITLTGVTVPDNAVMFTGGVGYTYSLSSAPPLTQDGVLGYQNNYYPNGYPATASTVAGLDANLPNKVGGIIVVAPDVQIVGTGSGTAGSTTAYTGRRPIVEDKRCNACHRELGLFTTEAFHGGQRNDGTTCAWCHNPNRTSSGWSADSNYFIHAIHAADKRAKPFTWHASTTTESFADIGYPGVLSNCETCHLAGTYDFSASASSSALPNRLYRTVGTGIYNGTAGTLTTGCTVSATNNCIQTDVGVFSLSPYVVKDNATDYGKGFSASSAGAPTNAASTTLVISPIATACFACHDDDLAKQHMESNGGSIYQPRSTALAKGEQCTLCHLAGKVADIKKLHPALPKP